jgi:TetR/AcrR family transcriptional regulator, cholesterol catabolism regulator
MIVPSNNGTDVKSKIDDPALVERRRKQITAASIKVFSERGYHPATIRDIAECADVSIGTIYQYFNDKEDLLYLAIIDIMDSYDSHILGALEKLDDPLERFYAAVRAFCRVNNASVEVTVLAYRETKSLRKERRNIIKQKEIATNAYIEACVRDCIEAGLFSDIDVELFVYQIVIFSHAWALKAWHFAKRMTVDEYINRGMRLFFMAALTGRGERQLAELRKAGRIP